MYCTLKFLIATLAIQVSSQKKKIDNAKNCWSNIVNTLPLECSPRGVYAASLTVLGGHKFQIPHFPSNCHHFFVSPERSSERDYVITDSVVVCMYVVCVCMW